MHTPAQLQAISEQGSLKIGDGRNKMGHNCNYLIDVGFHAAASQAVVYQLELVGGVCVC